MTQAATARSAALYAQALELMPGGVSSPVRSMGSIGRDPIFMAKGLGAQLLDVDGNQYIDWVGSWGPLILGHAERSVSAAVAAALERGTSYGTATEGEVQLAAEIQDRVPSVEMVRLVNSGTEASMSAIRLARAATGKERIIKFAGAYHGHVDGLLAEAGSGLATGSIPASPGVTRAQAEETIIVPWNDFLAVEQAFDMYEPAAVICEPIPANMGLIPPAEGFLAHLRTLADRHEALLVFDEVITGFRVARGGAQELHGVTPDLTVMGKVIGGGLPAAAYGGRRDLMEMVAPAGEVYQAGTLSGNPLAVAAGLATLAQLDASAYEQLAVSTRQLAEGLRGAIEAADAADRVCVADAPGLLTLFFAAKPPHDFAGSRACDHDAFAVFCREMISRGIYLPPSQYEAWFISLAHDDDTIERTCAAATEAIAEALK